MQAILATKTDDRLDEVAEQTGRIYEIGTNAVVAAIAPSTAQTPMQPQSSTSQTTTDISVNYTDSDINDADIKIDKRVESKKS